MALLYDTGANNYYPLLLSALRCTTLLLLIILPVGTSSRIT